MSQLIVTRNYRKMISKIVCTLVWCAILLRIADNSGIIVTSPSIITSPMFIPHFFFLRYISRTSPAFSTHPPFFPRFLLVQTFLTILASLYLAYLYLSVLFSSLSLLVSLCNCVAFCAVFCACHPRKQAGRSPPSPQRQRAAQPYEYKYKICIQSDLICNSGRQGSAAFERLASHFEPNRKKWEFTTRATPVAVSAQLTPPPARRWIVENELSSDNQSRLGAVLNTRASTIFFYEFTSLCIVRC